MIGKKKLQLWINAFLPPVLWAGIIFLFSSQQALPGFDSPGFDFFLKKFAHMFVYAVLYLLLSRGSDLVFTGKKQEKLRLFFPIVLVCLYAISDEIHQSFVPNRYATLRDVGYDILGSSLVMLKKYNYI